MFTMVTWSAVEASRFPLSLTPTRRWKLSGKHSKCKKEFAHTVTEEESTVEGVIGVNGPPLQPHASYAPSNARDDHLPSLAMRLTPSVFKSGVFLHGYYLPGQMSTPASQLIFSALQCPCSGPIPLSRKGGSHFIHPFEGQSLPYTR